MIRASNLHRICSTRLEDNSASYQESRKKLIEKVTAKKLVFSEGDVETYTTTQGLMTVAKDYISERDKYAIGAKTYMKELWLEIHHNFVMLSSGEEGLPTKKGKLVEGDAIKLLSNLYGIPMVKNEERVEVDFLTGEADIVYVEGSYKVIRDNKSPANWMTFRSKMGIPSEYYWQLIGYCYLYGAKKAYLDYTLMPTPEELLLELKDKIGEEEFELHKKMNEEILNLPPEKRVKTFLLKADLEKEIAFMLSRIEKCKEYFNTLNYDICMNINNLKEE